MYDPALYCDLVSTREVVSLCSANLPIGAHTQDLVPEQTKGAGSSPTRTYTVREASCRKILLSSHAFNNY